VTAHNRSTAFRYGKHHAPAWSEFEDEILKKFQSNPGVADVPVLAGRTVAAVKKRMQILGIPYGIHQRWTEEDVAKLRGLIESGHDFGSIANELGRSISSIQQTTHKFRIKTASVLQRKNAAIEILIIEGKSACRVPLTKGHFALIDEDDRDLICRRSWCVRKSIGRDVYYTHAAKRGEHGEHLTTSMHVEIMGVHPGMDIDHINGDGLDNRRSNLRVCPHQKNAWNAIRRNKSTITSGYKGVSWYRRDSRWRAYVVIDAKQTHLGYFDDEVEAAMAYDKAARELFGEFARVNFPTEHV
jgi:hypothetical protein